MPLLTLLLAGFFGLLSLKTQAGNPAAQLTQFFKARNAQHAAHLQVVLQTPIAQWPSCETPQFTLPGLPRQWGTMSVIADCGQERRYLQVQLQATGQYVVSSRQLPRGSAIDISMLQIKLGRIDTLPINVVLDPQPIMGAITLRDIPPGQPVTLAMIRQPWRIKAGQSVNVMICGEGFTVSRQGRAIHNAAVEQPIKVRMSNGHIVTGNVDSRGHILMSQ